MAIGVSPLVPSETREGYSLIPTNAEMLAATNNTKSVTPALAARFYIGYYSATRSYQEGDCVFFDGAFYTALLPNTGIAPLNPTYWANSFTVDTSNFVIKDSNGGVVLGANWTLRQIGTDLYFLYNGARRVRISSNGLVTSVNDVGAFGDIG